MKNKNKIIYVGVAILFGALILPHFVSAQDVWPRGYWGPLVDQSCPAGSCGAKAFVQTVKNFIAFFTSIIIFVLAPTLIMWAGLLILTSGGNESRLEEGKKILEGTVMGILIALLAYTILKTLLNAIGVEVK